LSFLYHHEILKTINFKLKKKKWKNTKKKKKNIKIRKKERLKILYDLSRGVEGFRI
jgi:hypothetical protein